MFQGKKTKQQKNKQTQISKWVAGILQMFILFQRNSSMKVGFIHFEM